VDPSLQIYPPTLRKLKMVSMRPELRFLPHRLKALSADEYSPNAPESLVYFSQLAKVGFNKVNDQGLESLATLPRLKELRVNKLHRMDLPLFGKLERLVTDRFPYQEDQHQQLAGRLSFTKLKLYRPTPDCVGAILRFDILEEVIFGSDPGLT